MMNSYLKEENIIGCIDLNNNNEIRSNTLAQLKRFRKKAKFFWCQEEPQNMGAWNSARNYIEWTLNHISAENREVTYIGRKPAASPATGYIKRHIDQQKQIVEKVLSE